MTEATAHAKINLRHRVFARDESGFHGVETLLARTSLHDSVRVEESPGGITLTVEGPLASAVPEGAENLCWRAAEAFLSRAFAGGGRRPGLAIHLTKRVPVGAGLGGGSADAAAVLRLLGRRWDRMGERDLLSLAGELGSDVAFGLADVPLALGWERGRRLLPLRPPPPRPALLVVPPFGVATPDAYAWLSERRSGIPPGPSHGSAALLPGPARLRDWTTLERLVRNDLEDGVFERHPVLAACLDRVRGLGAASAGMTGSGSALFCIFTEEAALAGAASALERVGFGSEQGWRVLEARLPI